VKFTAAISFGKILPSLGFSWHGTDFGYRVLWGKIYRHAQPVFNRAACFVVNFTAVRAWFNRRLFVANACSKQSPPSLYCPTFTSSPPSRKF